MNVLITGGAGYIGSHVNRLLAQKGVQTIVLDDLSDGHDEAVTDGVFIRGDFGDSVLLNQIMSTNKIDAVMHFAAFASVPDSVKRPTRYYHNNVTNMQTLLNACIAHKIGYFVFSSSAAIFGEPLHVPMDEEHPKDPINPYGTTKLIGEKMLMDYQRAYGLQYCAFRYFCAAGVSKDGRIGEAHNPETHLIPVMVKAAREGRPFQVFGDDYNTHDGSCIRDFIHVLDLAEAHWLGLQYIMENNTSDVFNLGSGKGFSVLEMIRSLEEIAGERPRYAISARREGDPAVLVASNEKAKRVLGWEPKNSDIHTILRDAWQWENNRRY